MISLADTVGMASLSKFSDLVGAVTLTNSTIWRSASICTRRPDHAAEKILAAYDAGCRRFDSAIGGLGGCPFAQDALVGNIATEGRS